MKSIIKILKDRRSKHLFVGTCSKNTCSAEYQICQILKKSQENSCCGQSCLLVTQEQYH